MRNRAKQHHPKPLSKQDWIKLLDSPPSRLLFHHRNTLWTQDASHPESAQNLLLLYWEQHFRVAQILANVDEFVLIPMLQKIYSVSENGLQIAKLFSVRTIAILNPQFANFVVRVTFENLEASNNRPVLLLACIPAMCAFENGGPIVSTFLDRVYDVFHDTPVLPGFVALTKLVTAFYERFASANWFDKEWVGYLINYLPQLVHHKDAMLHWATCVETVLTKGILTPSVPMYDVLMQAITGLLLEWNDAANAVSKVLLRATKMGYNISMALNVTLDTLFQRALVEPFDSIHSVNYRCDTEQTSFAANLMFEVAETYAEHVPRICALWFETMLQPTNCSELEFLCALFHRTRDLQQQQIISTILLRYENNEFSNLPHPHVMRLCLIDVIRNHLSLLDREDIHKYLNLTLAIFASTTPLSSFSKSNIFTSWLSIDEKLRPFATGCIRAALMLHECQGLEFVLSVAKIPSIAADNASMVIAHCIQQIQELKKIDNAHRRRIEGKHYFKLFGVYGCHLTDENWKDSMSQVLFHQFRADFAASMITESAYDALFQLASCKREHVARSVHIAFVKQVIPLLASASTTQQGYIDSFLNRILNTLSIVFEKSQDLVLPYITRLSIIASHSKNTANNAKTELAATILYALIACKRHSSSLVKVEKVINSIKFGIFPDALALAASRFPLQYGEPFLKSLSTPYTIRADLPAFVTQQAMCAVSQMQPSEVLLHCKDLSFWLDNLELNATPQNMWKTSAAIVALKKCDKWNAVVSNLDYSTISLLNYYDRCVCMFSSRQIPMHGTDVTFEFL